MIPHLPEMAIAIGLAVGFAAVGEIVLRRRSRRVVLWTESFLVGAGVLAATLFPLSLLWPHRALTITLALMGLALARVAWARFFDRADGAPESPLDSTRADVWSIVLAGMVVLVAAGFAVLDLRSIPVSDGFLTWASKAQILFYRGGLGRDWFPGPTWESMFLAYPPLVPLYEALLCRIRGSFDFDALQPVFVVFFVAMLVSTYSAARSAVSKRRALSAAVVLAVIPAVSTGHAIVGYADMPLAAFCAGTVAAGLRERGDRNTRRRPLPWLVGSLVMVKSEGILLLALSCAAIALLWWSERPRRLPVRVMANWRGATIIGGFVAIRWGYLRWLSVPPDGTYGPLDSAHLARARTLIRPVATLCWNMLTEPSQWTLLWPAFLLALGTLLVLGSRKEKCLALATAAAVVGYSGIFLLTNWPVEIHIPNSYDRLLVHLAPAATVSAVLAYARAVPEVPVEISDPATLTTA